MKPRVATGLYSHWDSVVKVDKKVVDWIKNSKKTKPSDKIDSLSKAVFTIEQAMKAGGREFLITEKVYKELDEIFPKRKMMLGGNGNNMGRMLFSLGFNPLVSYPQRPKKLMKASPKFRIALGKKIVTPEKATRDDPEYQHIIFEFENDRHILTWNPAESKGVFDNDFLDFACNKKFTDLLILAYAHLLLPDYKKRTDIIIEKMGKKRPKVHLEFGTGSKPSMKYAMNQFSERGCCDSFGLNEKECRIYFKAQSEKLQDLVEACKNAVKEYNVERICVHNPYFVFSISKYNPDKELEALKQAYFITTGFKDKKNIHESKEKTGKYNICLLKTKIDPSPKTPIGLGDKFSSIQAVRTLL